MEKTIGAYEDLQHDQDIYFVYSSEDRHRILSYKVGEAGSTLILEWSGFNWSADTQITGVAMVGDILVWCEGLDREIRSLNITKRVLYNRIKQTDAAFINLIKRPPLQSLLAVRAASSKTGPNLISEHSFTFSYRYIYEDGEVSVLAPYTDPVPLTYKGESQDTLKKIAVSIFSPEIPPLVRKVEFLVRRNQETVWYSIKTVDVSPTATYSLDFDNSFTGNAIAEDDALRPYDAIWPAKNLTIARNRLVIGNYAEGFDGAGDAALTISLQTAPPSAGQRIFKSNSSVRLGIVYYDEYGRNIGVITKPEWQINTPATLHKSSQNNYTGAQVSLQLTPPAWAKHWRLVKTPDMAYGFFLQGFGFVVLEQEIFGGDVSSSVKVQAQVIGRIAGVGGASELATVKNMFIDISSLLDRNIGYVFEEGDRISVYYTRQGETAERYISELPIMEQQGSLLKIPLTNELIHKTIGGTNDYNMANGLRFEISKPNSVTESMFYETSIGGKIVDAQGTTLHTLLGDVILHPSAAKNPKTYREYEVNTRTGSITINDPTGNIAPWLEAMSPWDKFYGRWMQNLGRVAVVLPDNLRKKVYKPTYERFSNKYIAGTQINGIASFEGMNEKELPMENGAINKLQLASNNQAEGTVLLAIMQNETESQYLGEAQWRDTQGRTTSAISDSVIGSTNTLRGGFGTINPESVVPQDGRVWWWDATKGEVIRYSADGLTPLARIFKMQKFFREVSRKQLSLGSRVKVYGGYNPETQEYVMTFSEVKAGGEVLFQGFTIAFSERIQGFSTFYSFQPEFYCKSNTRFVSFLDGKLYLHGENAVHNNFYGEQYPSSVRFVSSINPHQVKIWQSVAVEGEELWVPKELTNGKGQSSYMKADWFKNREGVFYGAIRRDVNSGGFKNSVKALNNGNVLRGQYLEVLIENETENEARLDFVNVSFIESSGHSEIQ